MLAIMTSKGQITIPAAIRNQMRLKTGDAIDFVVAQDDRVEMIPARTPVQALKGMIRKPKKPVSLKDMDAAIDLGGNQ